MKLLFDENLSRKLPRRLSDLYPGSIHVAHCELLHTADDFIWAYALAHDFIIVTKDDDFRHRSLLSGAPPKCIWLQIGNCGTGAIEKLLRDGFEEVSTFAETADAPLLMLS